MHRRVARMTPFIAATVMATAVARPAPAALPPGRQHRLTIEGENTVTFLPQAGLPPTKVEYKARVEYIVDTRLGKEAGAQGGPAPETPAGPARRSRGKKGEVASQRVSGAVDLSIHSSEMSFRQDGRTVLESKISRSRFQGRLQPDAPVLSVSAKEAPPRLQEILKSFDIIAATELVDDESRVVGRKIREDAPQRAILETLLSIHAPIPKDADSWELPSQLAMGHGQTAKGRLRFEKGGKGDARPGDGLVTVKVSGVLKAEGSVAGQFIKDGTYTVAGEQSYDTHTREWTSARWSVVVANELANPAGMTVARAAGAMTVESRAVDGPPSVAAPKP